MKSIALWAGLAITASLALLCLPVNAAARDESPADLTASNKATVEKALKAWMAGDGTALPNLLSEKIEWTITGNSVLAGTTHGHQELMDKILAPFSARFSQSTDRFRPRVIRAVYGDADTVIAQFDGGGRMNNGEWYQNTYLWVMTLEAGKVIRSTAFFDSIAFNRLWEVPPAAH